MTELFIEKIGIFKERTGMKGALFVFLIVLFFISLLSDVIYGSVTTASSSIKFVLLIGLGISFGSLFTQNNQPRNYVKKERNNLITPTQEVVVDEVVLESHLDVYREQTDYTDDLSEDNRDNTVLSEIRKEIQQLENIERAVKQREFFATKSNPSARQGRVYLGVNISDIVRISEEYGGEISLEDVRELLTSDVHDERIIAIWLLINAYKTADTDQKEELYAFYLQNRTLVDNWDMVDLAARNLIGTHIADFTAHKSISDELIASGSLWDKRTAVMSAHPLVLSGDLGYGFSVAERLIDCDEELVQSSIGWVLKEAYKQDAHATENFIKAHFQSLSKQAIRIGTERMEKTYRKSFLRGEFATPAV